MAYLAEAGANIIRIALGLIFLASALIKARRPGPFQTVIFLLSGPFRSAYKELSVAVWCSEIFAGASLCLGFLPVPTSLLTLSLMLLFDCVLVALRLGHPGVDCGCFGSQNRDGVSMGNLLRNLGMTLASAFLFIHTLNSAYKWQRASFAQSFASICLASLVIGLTTHGKKV